MTRNAYQDERLKFLSSLTDVSEGTGLEIGACNLPTVSPWHGKCQFADFRTAEQMTTLWGLDPAAVCKVDFVLDRSSTLKAQIAQTFDYVIACHVIEHIPNPIGYVLDLGSLLKPDGIVMLAVPDKRFTFDAARPLTTLDSLLMNYHHNSRYPSLQNIMEFHRFALESSNGTKVDLREAYEYAVGYHASGEADAHCHVWDDTTFNEQSTELSKAGFYDCLSYVAFQPTQPGFNEFRVAFRRNGS